jgi:glycyl-tRNA synthetase (class II)
MRAHSEFTMAEIEHYVDPQKKRHARFAEARDQKLRLLPKDVQSAGRSDLTEMTIGEAVDKVRAHAAGSVFRLHDARHRASSTMRRSATSSSASTSS